MLKSSDFINQSFFPKTTLRNGWKAVIILSLGLFFTFIATFYIQQQVHQQSEQEFALVCNEIELKISTRLHAYAQLLRSGSAFFAASDSISRREWKIFVEGMKIEKNLPGIQGVGFSLIVPKNQISQHIQTIRKQGFPDYTIKPGGERSVYSAVIYLEPFKDRNLRAFGYDMFSEPVSRKAMELSRDDDVAALSGKVILVQETSENVQFGTLMYVPVYRKKMPSATTEQRRAAIIGWVYCPFRMNDLMKGILDRRDLNQKNKIYLQIYDDIYSGSSLLYNSESHDTLRHANPASLIYTVPVEFNGKRWLLRFTRQNGEIFYFQSKVILVMTGGILLSLLIFLLALSTYNTRFRAQQIANQLTEELKISEELLREDQIRLKQAHKIAKLGSWEWNPVTDQIIYTDEIYNIFGIDREHFEGSLSSLLERVVHPEDREIVRQASERAMTTGVGQTIEYRIIRPDGEERWIRAIGEMTFDQGKLIKMYGANQDITERKKLDIKLMEALDEAQRFREALDYVSAYIYIKDIHSRYIYANRPTLTLLGCSASDLAGSDDTRFFQQEIAAKLKESDSQVLIRGEQSAEEIDVHDPKSGRHVYWEIKTPLYSHTSPKIIIGLLGISSEITERKKMEEALRKSEEKWRTLVSTVPEYIALFDLEMRYLFLNRYAKGFSEKDVIGRSAIDFVDEASKETYCRKFMSCVETKQVQYFEISAFGDNNETRTYEHFTIPIIENDKVMNVMTVARDITSRKLDEIEIKAKNEQLQKLNAEKDKFFSIIAHDLRSPFNGFLGLTEAMAKDLPQMTMDEIKEISLLLNNSAKNLYNLIGNLLDWSLVQRGLITFVPNTIILRKKIIESLDLSMEAANKKEIKIEIHIPDNITVFADENMFSGIIRNLVNNAVKFTKKGGIIAVMARQIPENFVEITVKDTGIGMDQFTIDNLFRLDVNTSRKGTEGEPSTGLGLIICKDFIEKHGGKIWVESKEGAGSTFRFSMPARNEL